MPRCQCKNTISNSHYSMSPLKPNYHTTVGQGYSNIDEAQKKTLKTNCMKMIEVLTVEINIYLTESQENTDTHKYTYTKITEINNH